MVSGLAKYLTVEELQNRDVVVLCNLKPAKLKGGSVAVVAWVSWLWAWEEHITVGCSATVSYSTQL